MDVKSIQHVTIIMAMESEAMPVVDALSLSKSKDVFNQHLPMEVYSGRVNRLDVSLVVSGKDKRFYVDNIGLEPATLMAYEAINTLSPDLIISAGTAGGFAARGADVGTVYLSEGYFVFHDRHVPLPGFDQSAIGRYPAVKAKALAEYLSVASGVVSSGSSLKKSSNDVAVIEDAGAVAKEMEAAAIAWVASLFDMPMMAIKSITNLVDQDNVSEDEFVKNLAYSSQCLKEKLIEALNFIEGKSLAQLDLL